MNCSVATARKSGSNMSIVDDDLNLIESVGLPEKVYTDFTSVMTSSGKLYGCTMMFNGEMVKFIKSHPNSFSNHFTAIPAGID